MNQSLDIHATTAVSSNIFCRVHDASVRRDSLPSFRDTFMGNGDFDDGRLSSHHTSNHITLRVSLLEGHTVLMKQLGNSPWKAGGVYTLLSNDVSLHSGWTDRTAWILGRPVAWTPAHTASWLYPRIISLSDGWWSMWPLMSSWNPLSSSHRQSSFARLILWLPHIISWFLWILKSGNNKIIKFS